MRDAIIFILALLLVTVFLLIETREELIQTRNWVINIAQQYDLKYTGR